MGREIVLFQSEERHGRDAVAAFLRQLADKLEAGEVILKQGTEELVLTIPTNVVLEVKAEEEAKATKTLQSLEVEVEWRVGEPEEAEAPLTLG